MFTIREPSIPGTCEGVDDIECDDEGAGAIDGTKKFPGNCERDAGETSADETDAGEMSADETGVGEMSADETSVGDEC